MSDASHIDPYKLFKVPKRFTLEQLRSSYKKLALAVHPDKPNGSEYLFKQITSQYKALLKDFERRKEDKQHTELKSQAETYISSQSQTSRRSAVQKTDTSSDFNVRKFNDVFNAHRMKDVADAGYGSWMVKSKAEREDLPAAGKNEAGEFDHAKFNDTFESLPAHVAGGDKRVSKHVSEPQPVSSGSKRMMAYAELGVSKVDDFGHNNEHKTLNFMDYRNAHSTSKLVDPTCRSISNAEKRHARIGTVDDLERERSSLSFTMSSADKRRYERKRSEVDESEQRRLANMRKHDAMVEKQYMRLNKLMLQDRL
jgi:curved DNA-binding protein CbpA